MSADDSARGQLAASWNQHCAPPWLTPECRTNSAPDALGAERIRNAAGHLVAVKPDIDAGAGRVADDDRMGMPPLQR